MKISPSIVRIKKIEPSQSKDNFSSTDLNAATQLILDMEGVITPIILLRTAPEVESYEVIEGNFEYYAALQAMKQEPRKRNLINAYIIESKDELPFYQQQIEVFRKKVVPTTVKQEEKHVVGIINQTVDIQPIIDAINNLSEQVVGIINQHIKRDTEVDRKFNILADKIANISVKQPEELPVVKPDSTIPTPTTKSNFFADFNNKEEISDFEFERKLKNNKITGIPFNALMEARKTKILNSSLDLKIKGVAKVTIDKIYDWS